VRFPIGLGLHLRGNVDATRARYGFRGCDPDAASCDGLRLNPYRALATVLIVVTFLVMFTALGVRGLFVPVFGLLLAAAEAEREKHDSHGN